MLLLEGDKITCETEGGHAKMYEIEMEIVNEKTKFVTLNKNSK